jgi:thiazole synthase ThiGH ThiG subunit
MHVKISAYADDIIITGRTKQVMIHTFIKLKNETSKYGLLINKSKAKYMKCTRKQVRGNKSEIVTMSFKSVQSFKYPGPTHNLQPANSYNCTQLTPNTASVVPPEDGRLTPQTCRELRHNKVIVKVKVY